MHEDAITALYSGPLEDFVRQRDALAKQLRSAGDRTAASQVRALRKPSRPAWALNLGVTSYPTVFAGFDAAVADLVSAQTEGRDVRGSMMSLRESVRDLAGAASRVAGRAGQRIEANMLSTALLAVLGSPESLERLRSGQLVEVPEAGGLESFARLPSPPAPAGSPRTTDPPSQQQRAPGRAKLERARRAAERFATAQARADATARSLADAEAGLAAAEERVREAERDLADAKRRQGAARREADMAAAELEAAQSAHVEARHGLHGVQ